MSLRVKFAMLLGIAGSTLLLALLVSVWSVVQLTQQIGSPFVGLASSMIERQEIERSLDRVESAIAREDTAEAAEAAQQAAQRAATLAARGWFDTGIGSRTAIVLRDGLTDLAAAIESAHTSQSTDPHNTKQIEERLDMLQSLLRRIESRLLDDATLALAHADRLPRELLIVVLAAALLATLILALGVALLQRWMIAPVGRLRRAAEHIGAGDFKHRIPVQGKDELARLSAEVNHMAETIENLLEQRLDQERLAAIGGMVRRLAHNLRNPLAGIRGLAELTRAELPQSATDPREHQQRIIEAVDRFERWLSDLLNVSTPTALHTQSHNPAQWLSQVVRIATSPEQGCRLSFRQDNCPDNAAFDAPQLEQAIISILANAIEATPTGGSVTVLATRPKPADNQSQQTPTWCIQIADQGQGIPELLREKVFSAYFTTKPDGKGIGLAVAQQIVHAHQGTIQIRDANPQNTDAPGAQFTISLPIRTDSSSPAQTTHAITTTNGTQTSHHKDANTRIS